MRKYKNFAEIERDLKLLKLQNDINKEKIKLSYNFTKESLAPIALLKSTAGLAFKSTIILKGTSKILGFVGSKLK